MSRKKSHTVLTNLLVEKLNDSRFDDQTSHRNSKQAPFGNTMQSSSLRDTSNIRGKIDSLEVQQFQDITVDDRKQSVSWATSSQCTSAKSKCSSQKRKPWSRSSRSKPKRWGRLWRTKTSKSKRKWSVTTRTRKLKIADYNSKQLRSGARRLL